MRAEELMRRIADMEADHAKIKREMATLMTIQKEEEEEEESKVRVYSCGGFERRPEVAGFSNSQCLNILESMGQAVHIMDCNYRIIYWNNSAQRMYGYTKEEASGKSVVEFIVDVDEFFFATAIIDKVYTGESWTGQFPLINKKGEKFLVVATNSPLYDDYGTLVGQISVTCDAEPFHDVLLADPLGSELSDEELRFHRLRIMDASKPIPALQHPLKAAISSKISNLASKVRNKVWSRTNIGKDGYQEGGINFDRNILSKQLFFNKEDSGISIPGEGMYPLPPGELSEVKMLDKPLGRFFRAATHVGEGKTPAPVYASAKAHIGMGMSKTERLWHGYEKQNGGSELGTNTHVLEAPLLQCDQSTDDNDQGISEYNQETQFEEKQGQVLSQVTASSPTAFDLISTSRPNARRDTVEISGTEEVLNSNIDDTLEPDILWKDLVLGNHIGEGTVIQPTIGSCGTVYSAKWNESEVAVKVFTKLDYADDVGSFFRQEISLMKRLRHPNVLLFMGAVTSGQHLCIVTEYLPRGSLFQLLQKSASKMDWRRRVNVALDIARGMNYLHCCNPPVIHRDLKSSNLLVDRNWTVKVGDFGLSRLKLETYFKTKSGKGTPQWMAPEVIRNEPSNEKSDVYSYGVILWELATDKVPWANLNPMQVIAAVGFMNQQLEIPKNVDPEWASMIECCWKSDLKSRPTFQELMERLKIVQKKCAPKVHRTRSASEKRDHIVVIAS